MPCEKCDCFENTILQGSPRDSLGKTLWREMPSRLLREGQTRECKSFQIILGLRTMRDNKTAILSH